MEIMDNFIRVVGAPNLFESEEDAFKWIDKNTFGCDSMEEFIEDNGLRKLTDKRILKDEVGGGRVKTIRFYRREGTSKEWVLDHVRVIMDNLTTYFVPSSISVVGTVRKSGTSLTVAITEVARELGLNAGDQVQINLSLLSVPPIKN